MDEILPTATLLSSGYSSDEIARLVRGGQLVRVRRGAYARPDDDHRTPEERHRRLLTATRPQLRSDGVISHVSAAILHGLPVWESALGSVHLTRTRTGGGKRRRLVEVHTSSLAASDVVTLDGVAVTSLARTVADLGRCLPFEQAVAAGDQALRQGLQAGDLQQVLVRARGWPGVSQARRMAGFLDAASESAGESVSRVRIQEAQLPAPALQFDVLGLHGELVGRSDFCWEEQRTLGEFDGKIKYGRLLAPGQTVEEVVYREKLRQDALNDLGWTVVRWVWADLYRRGVIADRLRRAFVRRA